MLTQILPRLRASSIVAVCWTLTPVLSMLGCADDEGGSGNGTLEIPFTLGNDRSCESLGVEIVEARLDGEYRVDSVDCEAGSLRVRDVPPGAYEIELFALDEDGFAVLDSLGGEPRSERVAGNGVTTSVDPAIVLTAAPAQLLLRWDFGFGSCESAQVDHFVLHAWDAADGIAMLLMASMPCDTPGEGTGHYRTVPDPDRKLGGDIFGGVSVDVVDPNGDQIGDTVSFEFDAPGAGREVMLSLVCTTSGCEGSGEAD